jgi:hypothetical protein
MFYECCFNLLLNKKVHLLPVQCCCISSLVSIFDCRILVVLKLERNGSSVHCMAKRTILMRDDALQAIHKPNSVPLCRVSIYQVFMMLGVERTSPAIASAMPNLGPGFIFVIAACLRFNY